MFLAWFLISFFVSLCMTFLVILVMKKNNILDKASKKTRKIHKKDIPLGGGLAIFISCFLIILFIVLSKNYYFYINVLPKQLFALFLGSLVLMIGGFLDDKYDLKPKKQIIFPILASLIIIVFGIGPHNITNPFGGFINLSNISFSIFSLGNFVVLADLLVFSWLMLIMYSTKFLDGLDGLTTSIVFIGSLVIFFLSLQEKWFDKDVAMLAIVFAGSCLGFLVWNFNPAKIFLGEGGSLFLGFFLGVLAIISGGKIATTMLVMAIPIIDVLRVVIIRIKNKKPIYKADNEHIHYKLLKRGYSQKQVLFILCVLSFLFGINALYMQTSGRFFMFVCLVFLMLVTLFLDKLKKV